MIDLKPSCSFCMARSLCEIQRYVSYFARDVEHNIGQRNNDPLPLLWPDGERLGRAGLAALCCAAIATRCELFTPRKEHEDG